MPQIRHRWSFASTGARDAFVYPPDALNQWVRVTGSPPVTYQITSVSTAGVATFATLGGAAAPVSSVFGRVGAVVAVAGDYAASQVTNDSSVAGATVKAALNALLAAIPPAAPVSSVFGRTGAVVAASGDYTAAQVTNAVATSRTINTTSPITGGGDLSSDRTIAFDATAAQSVILLPRELTVNFTVPALSQAYSTRKVTIDAGVRLTLGAGALVAIEGTALVQQGIIWHPDAPPATPHRCNDEFEVGTTLDQSRWNKFLPANITTITQDGKGNLAMSQTTHAGNKLEGIIQPIPQSEFAFGAKCSYQAIPTATFEFGIMVLDANATVSPTTAKIGMAHIEATALATAIIAAAQTFTDYQTFASTQATVTCTNYSMYLRGRLNGTGVSWDLSWNGLDWTQFANTTLSFTPAFMGLIVNNVNTGVTQQAKFGWFRVFGEGSGSSGIDATSNGGTL